MFDNRFDCLFLRVKKRCSDLRCDTVMVGFNLYIWVECQRTFTSHFSFRFTNMFFVEQKLPIQIADINRIQIDLWKRQNDFAQMNICIQMTLVEFHCNTHDFNVWESWHDQIFQDFTTNSTCSNNQNFTFVHLLLKRWLKHAGNFRSHFQSYDFSVDDELMCLNLAFKTISTNCSNITNDVNDCFSPAISF